jgi:hypothetical protein
MRLWRIAASIGIVGALTGCFTVRGEFGSPVPEARLGAIRDGVTTREEIIAWFGPPSAFFKPGLLDLILEGEPEFGGPVAPIVEDVYTYRYIETQAQLFVIPIFYARVTSADAGTTLTVFFDELGVVRYHAFRRDDNIAGRESRDD